MFNTGIIYDLIHKSFTDNDLIDFSLHYFPEVAAKFGTGYNKSQKIRDLLEHVKTRNHFSKLKECLEKERPEQFKLYENEILIDKIKNTIKLNSLDNAFVLINNTKFRHSDLIIVLYSRFGKLSNKQSKYEFEKEENLIKEDLLGYFDRVNENAISSLNQTAFIYDYIFSNAQVYNEKDPLLILDELNRNLADLYIKPSFIIWDSTDEVLTDLEGYIYNWLESGAKMKNLLILGVGGVGKTSLLKYLFIKTSEKLKERNTKNYYPIYISLNNIISKLENKKISFLDFLFKNVINESNLDLNIDFFRKLLDQGKLLFLLDAFDEIGYQYKKRKQHDFFEELKNILIQKKGNKLILSGRPTFFESVGHRREVLNSEPRLFEKFIQLPYFEELVLLPLTDSDILTYMGKYFMETTSIDKKFQWIKEREVLYKLSQNPFYLTIICQVLEEIMDSFNAKKSVTELSILKEYIKRWLDRASIKNTFPIGVDKIPKHEQNNFIKEIFYQIAIDFYSSSEMKNQNLDDTEIWTTMNKKFIEKSVISVLGESKYKEKLKKREDQKKLINEVLNSYFLILDDDDSYKFLHDIFFYYFIVNRIDKLIKNNNFNDPLIQKYEWNQKIVDFYSKIFVEDKKIKAPSLLYLRKNGKIRDVFFRIISSILLFLIKLLYYLTTNPFLYIIFIPITLICLYLNIVSCLGGLGIIIFYLILLLIVCFVMTKKQKSWNKVFRKLSKQERKDFNFKAKAYQIAFKMKRMTPQKEKKLFIRLFCTYSIFNYIENLTFDKTIIVKHNIIDVFFNNFKHLNGKIIASNFHDCTFHNVDLTGTHHYLVSWEGSKIKNVDFENMGYNWFTFMQLNFIRWFLKFLRIVLKDSDNPTMYLMEFTKMKENDIDNFSLQSLYQFIKKNNLEIGKHVQGMDWFEKKLKEIKEKDHLGTS